MPFFGASNYSDLIKWYGLPENFRNTVPVSRKTMQVCNGGKQCVGGLGEGTTWKGRRLQEFTFIYSDGSEDIGHPETLCTAIVGENTFAWSEA